MLFMSSVYQWLDVCDVSGWDKYKGLLGCYGYITVVVQTKHSINFDFVFTSIAIVSFQIESEFSYASNQRMNG